MQHIKYVVVATLFSITSFFTLKAKTVLGVEGEEASSFGFYIYDLKADTVVFESNAQTALMPASITKSVTSATALLLLDNDYRFETRVNLKGVINASGKFDGSIIIESSGDPTLECENFKSSRGFCDSIVSGLKRQGITEICGNIIVKDDMPDRGQVDSWAINDTPWGYGAGHYGFNYKKNTVYLWPNTGKTKPEIPGLIIDVKKGKSYDLVRGVNSSCITVYGTAADIRNPKWYVITTMPDPSQVFRNELISKIKEQGIGLTLKEKNDNQDANIVTLVTHRSPRMYDILKSLMLRSDNLFAEGVLRAFRPGATRNAALAAETALWRSCGISTDFITIRDGSGLSRADRLSPIFMAKMLKWMAKSKFSKTYVSLFPVSGVSGTMKHFGTDKRLKGRLAFKTGSLNGVQTYAGYVLDDKGTPTHIVVIMANSFFCSRSELKTAIERFILDKLKF